ncbi:recombination-associated protein RdgC [Alcaligenes endophyticus]|uniref:Recombination-associated protein RdgC n=1 Tax=Alcaligenes endophyticus TaxID=1929088 RepID=A0ABT8EKS8_9BURK|nr:recombination-associated protein RdgC [Alcaligenes endophyticus]MCX5590734.1 recombination-associated protein RdgC [Alcaligenes endophyticus]MDN4121902.1 recombination-associated protein RdgC [Alcaligenes endophyticus]
MWFKNLRIYRLSPTWQCSAQELEQALEKHAFTPGSSQDPLSLGWVSPLEQGGLVHEINGQYLIALRAEKKLLPASVINQFAREKARDIEEQQGYKPGRKQMKEIKEQILTELLPRAFAVARDTRVWLDMKNKWLAIDAAATAKSDEILGLLAKSVEPFPVLALYTEQSPGAAMTQWLVDDEAPGNFTIDQDTELRSTGDSGAAIRYVKQSADLDEVRKHVAAGKQCTRLAMTWADRISFVLTDAFEIKRVAPLDILTEKQDVMSANDQELFDADFTLMSAELAKLISELVDALGGERQA